MVSALAIDIGSSSVRTGIVDHHGVVSRVFQQPLHVRTPNPGQVELDPAEIVRLVLDLSSKTLTNYGPCDVVGITNQRATTIVFDPRSGDAVGPALGWQDLRTVIDCLVLQGEGLRLAPNQSATKAKWLVTYSGRPAKSLRFATIETWVTWHLTNGVEHVTDRSNAGVNGLVKLDLDSWDERILSLLDLDPIMMPRIVDTMCNVGPATALPGAPMITALVGDQSASLFGQSCITRGAKITFGTGAMLDMVRGDDGPTALTRFDSGCFPVVAYSNDRKVTWAVEGIVLSAGACIQWLCDDLGLIRDPLETDALATSVTSSGGVSFVPALSGLGTPQWDFGARGGFFGLTRGSTKAHLVRAVLEGIAQRGADLVDAAHQELGSRLEELRVDGGMSVNRFLMQCLADFTGLPIAVSTEREATMRGAGLMALVSAGHLHLGAIEGLWSPAEVFTPLISDDERAHRRLVWADTLLRAGNTIPELSAVEF